jgi:diguanylate cyclase (GGDEF)-like protein
MSALMRVRWSRAGWTEGRWTVVLPAALALVAMVASRLPGASTAAWDVAWTAGAAAALAGMASARAAAGDEHRGRWTCWTLAAAFWLAGQVAWDSFGIFGSPPSPSAADVCWWAFAVLVIAGLLRTRGRSHAMWVLAVVEKLPLIAAVMALTFAELWSDAASSSLSFAARASALTYPVVYVSAAVLTLQALIGGSLRGVRARGPALVLVGMVAQAVAFIVWSKQLLDASYSPGATLIDPLWVIGLLIIAAGGVLAARDPQETAGVDEPGQRGGLLPAATFLVLIAAVVHSGFSGTPAGARLTLGIGLTFCGAALVTRGALLQDSLQLLLARERSARADLAGREAELARLNTQLAEDARRDPLTGVFNRRALAEDLAKLGGERVAVALCDVDCFKAYNDRFGHLAGDQALRALVSTVRGELRTEDRAYRYGGEELLLVLRDVDERAALAIAERIRSAVAETALPHPDGVDGILTVSIGVAADHGDARPLISRADTALYRAKRAGRNRVTVGAAAAEPELRPVPAIEHPLKRHLRGMVAISRAASAGGGPAAVLHALATTIRSELQFQTVVANLRDDSGQDLRVVVVLGDQEARAALLDTVNPWAEWEPLMSSRHERCGAIWLPAGSYDWSEETTVWTPPAAAAPVPDAWDPEDMLLLPLRGADGQVLAVISVDQPLSGRRPDDAELTVLMAVADHAGLALEHAERAPLTA